ILYARGELDEALRICQEEVLPVYEGLKDVREISVTLFKIANIHIHKNEYDEAEPLIARAYDITDKLDLLDGIGAVGEVYGQFLVNAGAREQGLEVLGRAADAFATLKKPDQEKHVRDLIEQIEGGVAERNIDVDTALATAREQEDLDHVASLLWAKAQSALEQDRHAEAEPLIAEAYAIVVERNILDGIGVIGAAHGQFLVNAGAREQGLEVLGRAADAFGALGKADMEKGVREMIENQTGTRPTHRMDLRIVGPDADKTAGELNSFFVREFETELEAGGIEASQPEGTKSDPVAIAGLVLAIPAAILSVLDLAERLKRRQQVSRLLELARKLEKQGDTTIQCESGGELRDLTALTEDDIIEMANTPPSDGPPGK
ncbi:MAG: hypothetical protein HQ483_07340, partial [Rhodospirillales bacterium]|nr:hypothetical protein [Rhodospirillales bacterium]